MSAPRTTGSSGNAASSTASASWGEWLSRHSTAVAASLALVSAAATAAILYHRRRRGTGARPRPLRSAAPLTIVELAVYPIKSCRGISLARSPVGVAGLAFDRQWMLVDAATRVFVSQRECPQLARVETVLDHTAGVLIVRVPTLEAAAVNAALPSAADASATASAESDAVQCTSVAIPLAVDETTDQRRPRVSVTVWKSQCAAVDEGDEAAAALSRWCGRAVRLVRMAPEFRRALSDKYRVREDDHTNFADGFPILVTTTGSLRAVSDAAAASSASASPVRSVQFRPNVIIATEHAWEEDDWHTLRITSSGASVDKNSDAETELRLVKPCTRCEIPTIDPERGAFAVGGQPTSALLRLGRANENGTPLFGVNAIPVFGPAGTSSAAAPESGKVSAGAHANLNVHANAGADASLDVSASASANVSAARAPARGTLCVGDLVTVVAYQP